MVEDILYPVIIVKHVGEESYSAIFPDVPNAVTQGDTLGDAFLMAIEMLTGMLHEDCAAGKALPNPSKVEHIEYRDFFRKEFEEELDEDTQYKRCTNCMFQLTSLPFWKRIRLVRRT
ncbi:MAG TPA: hypothetical protein DEF35_12270 [Paenibacillus sp.]|uniref:type II toxin-antitoxin system HicB family antitoxin n=1 Tax=Paenibacillus TaxID=44249 RepID=UPI000BA048B5|nr:MULTISPECIES: type II toxin-antitoxin system HicB family antitoxin [Paenibacillus]OZQ59704.1 hypothetical protein CA599_31115 [Paenibacillus taichungensis]HBU82400.1 hypothetical protein [Paenibacillus sp.]